MIRTALSPLVSNTTSRYRLEIMSARRIIELLRLRMPSKERNLAQDFDALRIQYFNNYWTDVSQAIGANIEDVGEGFYRLSRGKIKTFVYQGQVMLDDHLTLRIAGNKPMVNRLLKQQGFTVPDYLEYDLSSIDKAITFMLASGTDCVVKPASGTAGGRGVSTKINTKSRLIQASCLAAAHSSNSALMIENEHTGGSYRLLYLNGNYIDAIRRESPGLSGDGRSNVKKLVAQENEKRLSDGDRALSPLTLDLDACNTLADQGLTKNYVAPTGEIVRIKTTSNQYSRNENITVKHTVHPTIIDYGRKISLAMGVQLSGIDLMLKDHTKPLYQSHCRLNEINTTPGLHHHALISNTAARVNVGEIILNYIFDRSGGK